MRCKKCNFENEEGIGFCLNCGEKLIESNEETNDFKEVSDEGVNDSAKSKLSQVHNLNSSSSNDANNEIVSKKFQKKYVIIIIFLIIVAIFVVYYNQTKLKRLYEEKNYSEVVAIYEKKGKLKVKDQIYVANSLFKENKISEALDIYSMLYNKNEQLNNIDSLAKMQGLYNYVQIIISKEDVKKLEEFVKLTVENSKFKSEIEGQIEKSKQNLEKIKIKNLRNSVLNQLSHISYKMICDGKTSEKSGGYYIQENTVFASSQSIANDYNIKMNLSQGIVSLIDNFDKKVQFNINGGQISGGGKIRISKFNGNFFYSLQDILNAMGVKNTIEIDNDSFSVDYKKKIIRVIVNGSEAFTIEKPFIKNGKFLFPAFKIFKLVVGNRNSYTIKCGETWNDDYYIHEPSTKEWLLDGSRSSDPEDYDAYGNGFMYLKSNSESVLFTSITEGFCVPRLVPDVEPIANSQDFFATVNLISCICPFMDISYDSQNMILKADYNSNDSSNYNEDGNGIYYEKHESFEKIISLLKRLFGYDSKKALENFKGTFMSEDAYYKALGDPIKYYDIYKKYYPSEYDKDNFFDEFPLPYSYYYD